MNKRIIQITIGLSSIIIIGSISAGTAFAAGPGLGRGPWFGRSSMPMMPAAAIGTVSSISGNTIVLNGKNGTTYTVDASNATITKNGASSSITNISNGDTIIVQGPVNGTSIAATSIYDGIGYRNGSGIFGNVASINGTTLTITSSSGKGKDREDQNSGTTYTVDASNAVVTKANATSSVSSIAVGDMVFVQGTVSGTSVTATSIRDGIVPIKQKVNNLESLVKGNGQPVVGGTITSISGTTITITNKSNVTYTINAASSTLVKSGASTSISSIAVGDNVIVQGVVNGNSIIASSIIDSGSSTGTSASSTSAKEFSRGIFGIIGGFFQHLFGFF